MNKIKEYASLVIGNDKRAFAFIYVVCLVLLFLSSHVTSPIYNESGYDSQVFIFMGRNILAGGIPYKDLFDHKGPILYLFQVLGLSIYDNREGVFIIQAIVWFCSLLFLYRGLRKIFSLRCTLISILFVKLTFGLFTYDSGNISEEYMVMFVSGAFYAFVSSLYTRDSLRERIYSMIIGLCFAGVFFIRINDSISQFAAFPLIWLIESVRNGETIKFLSKFFYGFLGFCIVAIPILGYFYYNDALYDLFVGIYLFNAKYAEGIYGLLSGILSTQRFYFVFFPILLCVIVFLFLGKSLSKDKSIDRKILSLLLSVLFFSLLLIGQRNYIHYYQILVPCYVYLIAYAINYLKVRSVFLRTLIFSLLIFFFYHSARRGIGNPYYAFKQKITLSRIYSEMKTLGQKVPSDERGSIYMYDTQRASYYFFYVNKLLPMNHALIIDAYKIFPAYFTDDMEILKKKPKWIIKSVSNKNDSIVLHKLQSDYSVCSKSEGEAYIVLLKVK